MAEYIYNVILLGKYGVGKTTLMNKAIGRAEHVDAEEETASCGLDFGILQLTIDGTMVDMKIYDTGDMERYQPDLTSTYYHHAHLALLVYDITDETSFKSLQDDWLEDANKYCPLKCVKVVVTNKIDKAAKSACDKAKVKKWADDNGLLYEEVSAVGKDSVDGLFSRLARSLVEGGSTTPTPNPPAELCANCCTCAC